MTTMPEYDDTPYEHVVSSMTIASLFTDFGTAASLLRVSRNELRLDLIENAQGIVDDFYDLLERVQEYLQDPIYTSTSKFLIEIEGLDGSGKTTLVERLAQELPYTYTIATKTPSKCLSAIRPLWDHRGGPLARAFYTLSNYILEYEISTQMEAEVAIVIIDRWYASTCAYTVASEIKDLDSTSTSIPSSVFQWPRDLRIRPNILLILDIDFEVRQARVEQRKTEGGGASRFNQWDDRLAQDVGLGDRILSVLKRIKGPSQVACINANATTEQVFQEAMSIIRPAYEQQQHTQPHS
jgi:thymidylate kinase